MSILFHDMIFGPVHSRRLGISLGVNVLPEHNKFCSFNCIYCECGWTRSKLDDAVYHSRNDIREALDARCKELYELKAAPDAITFAGNGEPTLHPDFAGIIDDTVAIRDTYFPSAKVVVLSNSTTAGDPKILNALQKVDPIMKLDAGTEAMYRSINKPLLPISLEEIVNSLCAFKGALTIQTLFLKTEFHGKMVDNTTEEEVSQWLGHLKKINPRLVMIYPIDREAPDKNIDKLDHASLEAIAARVRAEGIDVKVFD